MLKKLFKNLPFPPEFDITVYLRYRPILTKINRLKGVEIAEIGSGNYGIGPYLKRSFWGFDLNFAKEKSVFLKPVKSSAVNIPKEFNQQFEAVLSVDMLEHLSSKDRSKAIKSMLGLTKKYLFLAFPSGYLASLTDYFLSWYYRKTHGVNLEFLNEHRQYRLPKIREVKKEVIKAASENGQKIAKIKVVNNTNALIYLTLLVLGFSENKYLTRLYSASFLIKNFLGLFNFFPYRRLIILEVEK